MLTMGSLLGLSFELADTTPLEVLAMPLHPFMLQKEIQGLKEKIYLSFSGLAALAFLLNN